MIPTPHISANKEDFANTVLMPGDPMRSKFIAETFFEQPRLVNNIRGVQGYSGYYKGTFVSVMSSGIGIPAMGLYSYELFNFYDIDRIIRIGTAGSIDSKCKVGDVLISDLALTNSSFYKLLNLPDDFKAVPSKRLLDASVKAAQEKNIKYTVGTVLTDELYYGLTENKEAYWKERGVLAYEMETACLYAQAAVANKEALALFTVSNDVLTGEEMDPKDREQSLTDMITIALDLAVEFDKV